MIPIKREGHGQEYCARPGGGRETCSWKGTNRDPLKTNRDCCVC